MGKKQKNKPALMFSPLIVYTHFGAFIHVVDVACL
jgi:hypothetical protein